jgi:hypothetical protein
MIISGAAMLTSKACEAYHSESYTACGYSTAVKALMRRPRTDRRPHVGPQPCHDSCWLLFNVEQSLIRATVVIICTLMPYRSAPAFARHVGVYSLSQLNGQASSFAFRTTASRSATKLLGANDGEQLFQIAPCCSQGHQTADLQLTAPSWHDPRLFRSVAQRWRDQL